jgi:hypothetical protein
MIADTCARVSRPTKGGGFLEVAPDEVEAL